jgi:hypothetical protein
MRLLRRSVALLLNLLLLQVFVLGGGAACSARTARAAERGQPAAPAAAPVHDAHHDAHAAAPLAQSHAPRPHTLGAHAHGDAERPASDAPQMPHCGLAAACLAPALASRTEPLPAVTPASARARVAQERAPRSAITAPEPPPPRA